MSGSGQVVTTTADHLVVEPGHGTGQMGLPGNIKNGSTDNHLRRVSEGAELFKYSAHLQCHLVRTEKNSSARRKHPAILLEALPSAVLVQVAPWVGKVCLAVVTNGSTLHRRLGMTQRIIANSLG